MAIQERPVASNWYVSKIGKLMKVRMVLMDAGKPASVMVEYLDGTRHVVNMNLWSQLDLYLYPLGEDINRRLENQ